MLRVGIALMMLAWAPVVLAFIAPGDASIRYWLFVAAHVLNSGGFVLTALADAYAKRPFLIMRFVLALLVEFILAAMGPVVMSAAGAWR